MKKLPDIAVKQEMDIVTILFNSRAAFKAFRVEPTPHGDAAGTCLEQIADIVAGDQRAFTDDCRRCSEVLILGENVA